MLRLIAVSTSTVPDTYPSTSHNIVRSQPASQTVPLAPDITPPAPSAHLSAASSRRAAGGAADIVLAAIQTTRQRSHGNTRPKGGRGRQVGATWGVVAPQTYCDTSRACRRFWYEVYQPILLAADC